MLNMSLVKHSVTDLQYALVWNNTVGIDLTLSVVLDKVLSCHLTCFQYRVYIICNVDDLIKELRQ